MVRPKLKGKLEERNSTTLNMITTNTEKSKEPNSKQKGNSQNLFYKRKQST